MGHGQAWRSNSWAETKWHSILAASAVDMLITKTPTKTPASVPYAGYLTQRVEPALLGVQAAHEGMLRSVQDIATATAGQAKDTGTAPSLCALKLPGQEAALHAQLQLSVSRTASALHEVCRHPLDT